jgi:hypothetical protein
MRISLLKMRDGDKLRANWRGARLAQPQTSEYGSAEVPVITEQSWPLRPGQPAIRTSGNLPYYRAI